MGSNLGSSCSNLLKACLKLVQAGLRIKKVSGIYLTEPVGFKQQPDFYNMVAEFETALPPRQTLQVCKGIETMLGRIPARRWGPRAIDIDILFYGNLVIEERDLIIPHPRIAERAFVLIPFKEIAPMKFAALGYAVPAQKVCLKKRSTDVKILLAEQGLSI